ncbi:MAG TPA: 5-(carboxyamino)imidazole ribonucleotide synthase [Burkholderiaceae bacterium]|jgi:5-(carboxyamino)imidazole ribonucleotide synthase|nr:5-(carboxyamino)imidazole ribonucleotide synthase [Burkholderiaceae bacterium]
MVDPGDWLGVLGGGQLGRMFCMAAQSLGYRVCVLDPAADSPAGAVADRHIRADYTDPDALSQLAALCRAVTTEFENVPASSLEQLARDCAVSPSADAAAIAQDRRREKRFAQECGLSVAPYQAVVEAADLASIESSLLPGVMKSARLGYDGKGQVRIERAGEVRQAWDSLGQVPCVLEKWLPIACEVSVVVCRGRDGASVTFPVAENQHRGGILAATIVPARVDASLALQARAAATTMAGRLGYVGVLCVEFFVLPGGKLLVNEMAPRPHNSAHYTIDACVTSQFDQQARILAELPLGDTRQLAPAVMLNLLGDLWFDQGRMRPPALDAVAAIAGACPHLYGKLEARPGRKMGHVTILGTSAAEALARAGEVSSALGLEPVR